METPKDTNDLEVDHNRTERDTDRYQERGRQGREEGQWVPKYIKMGGMHPSVLYHRTVSVVSHLLSSPTESRKRGPQGLSMQRNNKDASRWESWLSSELITSHCVCILNCQTVPIHANSYYSN